MTAHQALTHLYDEFVVRFGFSAEDCCDTADTITALVTLAVAVGCESPINVAALDTRGFMDEPSRQALDTLVTALERRTDRVPDPPRPRDALGFLLEPPMRGVMDDPPVGAPDA